MHVPLFAPLTLAMQGILSIFCNCPPSLHARLRCLERRKTTYISTVSSLGQRPSASTYHVIQKPSHVSLGSDMLAIGLGSFRCTTRQVASSTGALDPLHILIARRRWVPLPHSHPHVLLRRHDDSQLQQIRLRSRGWSAKDENEKEQQRKTRKKGHASSSSSSSSSSKIHQRGKNAQEDHA